MSADETALLRVRDLYGTSNRVAIGGRLYVEGDTFAVPADSVARWLAMGVVELATESATAMREDPAPAAQRRTRENTLDHWYSS